MSFRSVFLKGFLFSSLMFASQVVSAAIDVPLSKSVVEDAQLPFVLHHGSQPMENALAMNVQYAPVMSVRKTVSSYLHFQLKYFTGWNPDGEAHITVITPPEYDNYLKPYISMERIESLARESGIQASAIDILGIGSGETIINGKKEQTYFLIASSENLLNLRYRIYDEYLKNGGPKNAWDPAHFYPHITIGYTARDLHEADGVIKDVNHSLDARFQLVVTD